MGAIITPSWITPARWEHGRSLGTGKETLLLPAGSRVLCWLDSSGLQLRGQSPVLCSLSYHEAISNFTALSGLSLPLLLWGESPLKTPALMVRVRVPSSCKDSIPVFCYKTVLDQPNHPLAQLALTSQMGLCHAHLVFSVPQRNRPHR